MNVSNQDPRITAYALGEMSEEEQQAFEAELSVNPELVQEIDEIQALAAALQEELKAEPLPEMKSPTSPMADVVKPDFGTPSRAFKPLATAFAACLVAVIGVRVLDLSDTGSSVPDLHQEEPMVTPPPLVSTVSPQPKKEEGVGGLDVLDEVTVGESEIAGGARGKSTPKAMAEGKAQGIGGVISARGAGQVPKAEKVVRKKIPASSPLEMAAEGQDQAAPELAYHFKGLNGTSGALPGGFTIGQKARLGKAHSRTRALKSKQMMMAPPPPGEAFNREDYDPLPESDFRKSVDTPLSTFSVDVDTAAYSNMRRFLDQGRLPPKDSVRIEEMVNYFRYNYPAPPPKSDAPFSTNVEIVPCPWKEGHYLARIGLRGQAIDLKNRPAANLVFLLDVSGSMNQANKLPLLKKSLGLLLAQLTSRDRVAIVVYAGASGLVLPSTSVSEEKKILAALARLSAGGSTNGGAGIHLAYDIAKDHFVKDGINRVILATDGDFNVGTSSRGELERLIVEKAKSGVFLSVLGFGMGNYQDASLELLSGKGNGNYAYIDSMLEAQKALVEQFGATMVTIARDVKIQVEFNPAKVGSYRLIGYENRRLAARDFNDDKKDAGEIGAGHTVTALYELVPPALAGKSEVDPLKYQKKASPNTDAGSEEWMTVKLRYKPAVKPAAGQADVSRLLEFPVTQSVGSFAAASSDTRFATAVAGFGMLLRGSTHKGSWSYDSVYDVASRAAGNDKAGHRRGLIELILKAKRLSQQ